MHADQSRVGASFIARRAVDNPRQALIEIVDANKGADKDELFKLFLDEIEGEPGYVRAIQWYFFVNMYDGYVNPRTGRSNAPHKSAAVINTQIAQVVKSIKHQMLYLPMPNGKLMKDCTGAEMARFGNRFQRIADKVGKTKTVGSVLSEDQVKAIMK